jgi:hypothetical protein
MMRYELADYEWVAIKSMLRPHGIPDLPADIAWDRHAALSLAKRFQARKSGLT